MLLQQIQSKIKGLVFDMDGVLVDTSPSHSVAYAQLWQSLAIHGPEYEEIAGRSTKDVVAQYASHLNAEQQQKVVAYKQTTALEILSSAKIIYIDTQSALQDFHALGLPMVVASSASAASAELALNNADIDHFFQAVVTSANVQRSKPAPDLFLAGISDLGCSAENVLVFEDSLSGIQAGLASGAYVVAVRDVPELNQSITNHAKFIGHFDSLSAVVEAWQ